jgi:hypothetical protein
MIERLQPRPDSHQFETAVDVAQPVIVRNVIVAAEIVEEPCRRRLHAHHRPALRNATGRSDHVGSPQSMPARSILSVKLGNRADRSEGPLTVNDRKCGRRQLRASTDFSEMDCQVQEVSDGYHRYVHRTRNRVSEPKQETTQARLSQPTFINLELSFMSTCS